MTDATPILSLPLILPAQAQKHVTHNEALRLLDIIVQLSVLDRTRTTPPDSPTEGDRHIVAAGATGVWAGQDGAIAAFWGGIWVFIPPKEGWQAWVAAEDVLVTHDGNQWSDGSDRGLQVARLGISATADATNRLSVSSPATLLSHAGAGHQLKLNKAAAADTASLLFQTGWSGRAEIGTAGNDAFSLKVSSDGNAWTTALSADPATGRVTLPSVAITGGTISGITDLAIADGGTGASDAAGARANLGLGTAATATVTTTATDSTTGRLLKTGDGGWLGRSDTQNIDLDSEYFGFWGNNSTGTAPLVTPDGVTGSSRWAGLTLGAQNSRLQIAARTDNAVALYARTRNNSSWTPWRKVYDQSTILGTVSQSGGVPTGALIERGSNANGSFVRFAGGTQICMTTLTGSATAGVAWTYPAAFAVAPVVTGNAVATVLSGVCLDAAPGTVSATVSARDKTDARRADTIHIRAEGRWF